MVLLLEIRRTALGNLSIQIKALVTKTAIHDDKRKMNWCVKPCSAAPGYQAA